MTSCLVRVGMACAAGAVMSCAAMADDPLPPFDFSDQFYLANGINPATLVGRPTGTPPNSIIDNRENGPDFNNVRLLQQTAAFDHSGQGQGGRRWAVGRPRGREVKPERRDRQRSVAQSRHRPRSFDAWPSRHRSCRRWCRLRAAPGGPTQPMTGVGRGPWPRGQPPAGRDEPTRPAVPC